MRNGFEGNPIRQPKNLVQETVRAGIAQFDFKNGFTFSSGLVSPIYVDGRAVMAHLLLWKLFVKSLSHHARDVDLVAGVAYTGLVPVRALVDESYRSGVISRAQYDAIVLWLCDVGSSK